VTVAEVRERVRVGGLLSPDSVVVAMLSGGRDSVCLLDVAVAVCGAERVHALHVNYGLRVESDGDERHCRELCERLGVGIEVVRASRDKDTTGNLHAWARELRYDAARELAERLERARMPDVLGTPDDVSERATQHARMGHAVLIATGHTASDQVETILYRLAASPGRRALLGMSASEGRLVRPLLGLTRHESGDYCRELNLAWRDDVSNDNERYARARVRRGLVKALDAVHPAAQANVLRTAQLLRDESELLDALVDRELGGRSSIAVERLAELPPALQRLVVIRLAEDAVGTFVGQAGEHAGEIVALGARGGRAELHVGGLASAVIEGGELRMVAIAAREQRPARRQAKGQNGRRGRRGRPG
jgi:tRNA(Ile)-lysidine synthase